MPKTRVSIDSPTSPEAINEAEGPVVLKLTVPRALYDEYAKVAAGQELSVAELMLHRLERCVSHSSIRSLYFQTSQLARLEELLQKRPVQSAEQALALLQASISVRIGDFAPIPLTVQQAKRLSMAAYGGRTVQDHLTQVVQSAVSKAVGI